MRLFRPLVWLAALLFTLIPALLPAAQADEPAEIGIVLMHGKWGEPNRHIDQLADSLRRAGFQVLTPEMPWSGFRSYDRPYDMAMSEIERALDQLKVNGAKRFIVAGHSLGANAALAYGAHHAGLMAVIAVAPGHTPELPDSRNRFATTLEQAKSMVASGHGAETVSFSDMNQGRMKGMSLPADIFVSYFDPDGLANMPMNAALQRAPVLVVEGSDDRLSQRGEDYIFNHLPNDPRNRYLLVNAGHLETPTVAKGDIVEWVNGLR